MGTAEPAVLDTAYVDALVNTRDHWHAAAVRWQRVIEAGRRPPVTTEFVLAEIADGLAAVRFRTVAAEIIGTLRASSLLQVVPASTGLLDRALELYGARVDKQWGLSDGGEVVRLAEPVGELGVDVVG
jgi:predicted nucleic acid-binding protein